MNASLRVLFVIPQMPQDPASGAARSTTTICEILAEAGVRVRALGTTATESTARLDPAAYLRELGCALQLERGRSRPELHFDRRGIAYRLIDVGRRGVTEWEHTVGRHFDLAFDDELRAFKPDLLFTYGGSPADLRRHHRAIRQGTRVVFGLRNEGYLTPGFFEHIHAVLTPSRYLSDRYRQAIGLESAALPSPIDLEDVVAPEREPIFVTMINPSPEKGVMFFARLAEELSQRRPDIPILAIESRGSAGALAAAGVAGGFDLRRHENIMFSAAVPKPKDIFHPARTLLAPSLQEAFGRVVVEAMLNGVPPLVSNRGGLAEAANGSGFVLPLPEDLTLASKIPAPAAAVEPWIEVITRLEDDAAFYESACAKAKEAGRIYLRENLAPRYVEFFLRAAS